jgi:hypothetical protein
MDSSNVHRNEYVIFSRCDESSRLLLHFPAFLIALVSGLRPFPPRCLKRIVQEETKRKSESQSSHPRWQVAVLRHHQQQEVQQVVQVQKVCATAQLLFLYANNKLCLARLAQ